MSRHYKDPKPMAIPNQPADRFAQLEEDGGDWSVRSTGVQEMKEVSDTYSIRDWLSERLHETAAGTEIEVVLFTKEES